MKPRGAIFLAALLFPLVARAQSYPPPVPPVWQGGGSVWQIDELNIHALIFVNNIPVAGEPNGSGTTTFPPGQWVQVDVTRWGVPANAAWVDLQAILIISHANNPNVGDMTISLRKVGSTETCGTNAATNNYNGQALVAGPGSGPGTGVRTDYYSGVQLVDGKFEFCWDYIDYPGVWPAVTAYGVNIKIQKYGMPAGY